LAVCLADTLFPRWHSCPDVLVVDRLVLFLVVAQAMVARATTSTAMTSTATARRVSDGHTAVPTAAAVRHQPLRLGHWYL
jgi:hypothetical protein